MRGSTSAPMHRAGGSQTHTHTHTHTHTLEENSMCRAVTCKTCGKTTWAGCGQHIDDVRRTVPAGRWCPGHEEKHEDRPARGLFATLFRR